jgi:hypothetical protein
MLAQHAKKNRQPERVGGLFNGRPWRCQTRVQAWRKFAECLPNVCRVLHGGPSARTLALTPSFIEIQGDAFRHQGHDASRMKH